MGLHAISWMMILAGAGSLLANLIEAGLALSGYPTAFFPDPSALSLPAILAQLLKDVGWSLTAFGMAANVEFLRRMLNELRELRRSRTFD